MLMTFNAHSQHFGEVNIAILSAQLAHSDQAVFPMWKNGKMYYVDSTTNKTLIAQGFDVAYPFFKKAALVKEKGKFAVIDKKGTFLLPPQYDEVDVAPFDHESHLVILNRDMIFDLNKGQQASYYLRDEEPEMIESNQFPVGNDSNGLSKDIHGADLVAYDSILTRGADFTIAKIHGKISVLGNQGNTITNEYFEDAIFSFSMYTGLAHPTFGLKQNGVWSYFKNGKIILKSRHHCISFGTLLPNSIGIIMKRNMHWILFEDGKISKKSYDFISENGLVGIRKNNVYVLKSDGSGQRYYHHKQ
ncbi:WG repeat-containing protein [Flagellimonas meishanensis]|uniref:WG repeat-containing protein n=1 Tax=Flagellimonas meishanensis TaxID=2873264 RepID=UPI001CA78E62|nr:WG repeat-containing protein [[Muricauda] meishanensis]